MKNIVKFVCAKYGDLLKIDNGTVDHGLTEKARKVKLFARTNGSFNDSMISGCFYAKKMNKKMFVYSGNSYGHAIWRVTYKESDALGPVNNTGLGLYTIAPDLTITYHTIPERVKEHQKYEKAISKG